MASKIVLRGRGQVALGGSGLVLAILCIPGLLEPGSNPILTVIALEILGLGVFVRALFIRVQAGRSTLLAVGWFSRRTIAWSEVEMISSVPYNGFISWGMDSHSLVMPLIVLDDGREVALRGLLSGRRIAERNVRAMSEAWGQSLADNGGA